VHWDDARCRCYPTHILTTAILFCISVCFLPRVIFAVRLFCTRLASPGTRVAFYARQNVPFVRARSTFASNRERSKKCVACARRLSTRFFPSERSERIFQVYDAGLALLPALAAPLFQSHRHFYEFGISLLFGPLGASFFTTARSLLAALS
jgi:hypothetical protein